MTLLETYLGSIPNRRLGGWNGSTCRVRLREETPRVRHRVEQIGDLSQSRSNIAFSMDSGIPKIWDSWRDRTCDRRRIRIPCDDANETMLSVDDGADGRLKIHIWYKLKLSER